MSNFCLDAPISTVRFGEGHQPTNSNGEQSNTSTLDIQRHAAPPFQTLPLEILGLIFRWCLDGKKVYLPICYDCSTVTMPWVLGQICSQWRNILMSDSAFWSSLTISYQHVRNKEEFTQKIKEIILPRTKQVLISLTCSNVEFREEEPYYAGATPTLIMPYLAQFRHLTLSLAREELDLLVTSLPGSMKALESVMLQFTWTASNALESFDFLPGSITVFEDAPKLRKVYFTGRSFCEFRGTGPLILPWAQLADIYISINLPYSAVVKFLPHCIQLVKCRLSVGSLDDEITGSAHPREFILPQLQSITLSSAYVGTFACPTLLQLLILPMLKDLTIHLYDRTTMQERVIGLIHRSGCLLENLEITGYFENALADVAEIMELTPSLRRLVAPRDYVLPRTTIERMATGELVPRLEAIHCQVASFPLILDLIKIRQSGHPPRAPRGYRGILCLVFYGYASQGMWECKCKYLEDFSSD